MERTSLRSKYELFNRDQDGFSLYDSASLDASQSELTSPKSTKKPIFQILRPESTYLTLEQALEYSGDNSTYPKRVLYLVSAFWVAYSLMIMGYSVFMGNFSFWCPDLIGSGHHACNKAQACGAANTLSPGVLILPSNSVTNEFHLVCNRSHYKDIFYSMLLFFNSVASVPFSYLAHVFGRKWTLILCFALGAAGLIGSGLSGSVYVYFGFVVLAGAGFGGLEVIGRVYSSEISSKKFRINSNAVFNLMWAGGQVILGVLGIFISNWR